MNKSFFVKTIFFLLLMIPLFFSLETFAAESKGDSSYQYSVVPSFGKTQEKDTKSFYDMKMEPSKEDQFGLSIVNNSGSEQKFQIDINTATTNRNVIVDYTKSSFKKDSSMKIELSKLVKTDNNQITIPPHQSKTARFLIKMPEQKFNGILLGSIVIRPINPKTQDEGIQNVFMHTIAIRIKQNDAKVNAILKSGIVRIGQENLHNYVSMIINNPQPKLMNHIQGTFYVNKLGSDKKLINLRKNELSIAPNSQFEVPVELKEHFKPGRYEYTIIFKNSEGTWRFKKEFKIKKTEAEKYNKTSVDQSVKSNNSWIIILLLIVILLLIIIIYQHKKNNVSR